MEDAYCFVIPVFRVRFESLKQRPILLEGISASHCVYRFTSTQKQVAQARETGVACMSNIALMHWLKIIFYLNIFSINFRDPKKLFHTFH